ncbi:MAG: hypothetical protein QUS07_07195 [Methanothrix sp.]|nr:hypothetical protein [Methanothrix sp.]
MADTQLIINLKVYPALQGAKSLEDVLCHATLIAGGLVPVESTTDEAAGTFAFLHYNYDCDRCPMVDKCLCMKVNE